MVVSGKNLKKLVPSQHREAYMSAVRDFTKMTMQDASFFEKTPEEQKAMAMAMLQEHKGETKVERKKD